MKTFRLFVILILILTGCKTKEESYSFTYSQLPSVIRDIAKQREYLSTHFWDNLPWDETTIRITADVIRRPYYEYLGIINETGFAKAEKHLKDLAYKSSSSTSYIAESFLLLFDESLNNPNSPLRHEKLYQTVIDEYIKNLPDTSSTKGKLQWERELLIKNRVGEISENFSILFTDGSISSLHSINSDYTLIFFFEPECNACKESIVYAENSQILLDFKSKNRILAIYTGHNFQAYEQAAITFPDDWRVGRDLNNMISYDRLYDRRASPSIYLLDNKKNVLMKDGDIDSVEKLIGELIK